MFVQLPYDVHIVFLLDYKLVCISICTFSITMYMVEYVYYESLILQIL